MCWTNSRYFLSKWDEIPCSNIDCSIHQICSNCNDNQLKRHCCKNARIYDEYRCGGKFTYGDNPKEWNRLLMAHMYYNRKQNLLEALTRRGACTPKFLKYLMLSSFYDRIAREKQKKLHFGDPFETQSRIYSPPFIDDITTNFWSSQDIKSPIYPILHGKALKFPKKWIKEWYEFYRDIVAPHTHDEWHDFRQSQDMREIKRRDRKLDIEPRVYSRMQSELYPGTDPLRRSVHLETGKVPAEQYRNVQEKKNLSHGITRLRMGPDGIKIEYHAELRPSEFDTLFYRPRYNKEYLKSYLPDNRKLRSGIFYNQRNRKEFEDSNNEQQEKIDIDEVPPRYSEDSATRNGRSRLESINGDESTGKQQRLTNNYASMQNADGTGRKSLLNKPVPIFDDGNEMGTKSRVPFKSLINETWRK
uniref:Uncharacterized protein n=1 Tax=Glossina palpalis gambiensis TaxID=67801 RepID=A0A1B0BQE1_9MUSC